MLSNIFQRTARTEPAAATFNTVLDEDDLYLTPSAQEKMKQLTAAADDDIAAIRIFVMGGGCSGMTYGMTYAEALTPHDTVLESEGYQLAVDAVALNFLRGCSIDYARQGLNESFVFNNVFQSVGGSGTCGGCGAAGGSQY